MRAWRGQKCLHQEVGHENKISLWQLNSKFNTAYVRSQIHKYMRTESLASKKNLTVNGSINYLLNLKMCQLEKKLSEMYTKKKGGILAWSSTIKQGRDCLEPITEPSYGIKSKSIEKMDTFGVLVCGH